ncbi:MAG: EamA family transporter [Candidatus Odinarchaeota archaeon]
MDSEVSAVFFGLAAATCWGAGDFSGGFATKRSNVYTVIIISQIIGMTFLVVLALILSERFPSLVDAFWGCMAGLCGGIGLVALYRGLSLGHMGIVAPISAVVTAIVPVIVGLSIEGLPAIQQLVGFGIALIAIWFISRTDEETEIQIRYLGLPILAGLGFGFFQVFIDRTSEGSVLWPLVAVRIASMSMLFLVTAFTKQIQVPNTDKLPLIALAGIFDSGGNIFFVLAAEAGRLDIAAILSSLSPAGTVLLSWLILKEKITGRQLFGILIAVIAVSLIAS